MNSEELDPDSVQHDPKESEFFLESKYNYKNKLKNICLISLSAAGREWNILVGRRGNGAERYQYTRGEGPIGGCRWNCWIRLVYKRTFSMKIMPKFVIHQSNPTDSFRSQARALCYRLCSAKWTSYQVV